jgi:LysM repeat protein
MKAGNTDSPKSPATWTGAAKVDMSKDGWKDRIQEYATAEFLEANGMDADLAKTVASTTNAKIKAKKAKKEEKTKAIESTAQTALAVTALVVTGGAAAPALGSVLTGTAGGTFYAVQGANIALQAAIGSRTGGAQGALAGVVNGTLQSLAATNLGALTKGSKELVGKAKEVQQIALDNPILIKALAATNVSYTKEDGWGIKANVTGVVNALGVKDGMLNTIAQRFNSVTIGQSQRGGATVNLGISTGSGTLGLNYTGNSGKWDGSFDVIERQAGTGNLSAELNYGEDGFSVSGNADLGNGLGFGLENGRNGMSGSLTILGSTQGTVDGDGNYEANGNFLGEISGQDIIDLNNTRQQQRDAEENERNPVKDAKDAKNAKDAGDAKEARDDDAKEVGGEEGPSGLVDLAFAGLGVVMSAGAAFLAGGGSGSASPSVPTSGQSGAGNGNTTTVGRKPEDDDSPQKQPTKEELANFKDNIFLNTTKAATDAYLNKLDAQGVDTKEMRAHAEALRAKGVRDLTPSEIQAKRLEKDLAKNGFHIDGKGNVWVKRDDPLYGGVRTMRASEAEANMIREGANVRTADMKEKDDVKNNLREVKDNGNGTYSPEPKDGWDAVARKTGLTIEELKRLNPGMENPKLGSDILISDKKLVNESSTKEAKLDKTPAKDTSLVVKPANYDDVIKNSAVGNRKGESVFVEKIDNPNSKLSVDEENAKKYYNQERNRIEDKTKELAANTPNPEKTSDPYKVKKVGGEKLEDIAKKSNVTVETLRKANGLDAKQTDIKAGTTLVIPTSEKTISESTIAKLAEKYHTSEAAFRKLNNIPDNVKIVSAGTDIKIPSIPRSALESSSTVRPGEFKLSTKFDIAADQAENNSKNKTSDYYDSNGNLTGQNGNKLPFEGMTAEQKQKLIDGKREGIEAILNKINYPLTQSQIDSLGVYFLWRGTSHNQGSEFPEAEANDQLISHINKGEIDKAMQFIAETQKQTKDHKTGVTATTPYLLGTRIRNYNTVKWFLTGQQPSHMQDKVPE